MKLVDEFRDKELGQRVLARIETLVAQAMRTRSRPVKIMEVCGGHTHTIFRYGIGGMVPAELELVHGPGCPVCVLPMGRVDDAVALAERPGVVFCTFGDAIRVPGSRKSLLEAKAEGADVRTVYSPVDALALARELPDREVVFFALGFETTAPSTALVVQQARAAGVTNFSVLSNHITVMPTIQTLLDAPDLELDGFVGPGHVTMVIGLEPYQVVADRYHKPLVVAGFEPLDVLQSIAMVLEQLVAGEARIENQYARVVRAGGNAVAQAAIDEVFEVRPSCEWRGLGIIPDSGLRLRESYAAFDAERRFALETTSVPDPKACQCGEVLKGGIQPWECKVFGTACTPETPIGACMVSSEGACAAYYNYGRLSTIRPRRSAS
ncbi:MAG: hydrogenase formation protein HypD [Deltaproteobacteria bacterium]|nr:hydrogenase formation protein HypD [Deltaproteobacteria bacterium]